MSKLLIESGRGFLGDTQPVPGEFVRFVTPEGRTAFEVRVCDDGRSIEVRAVDTYKVDGVIYDHRLLIEPRASNVAVISTQEYGK